MCNNVLKVLLVRRGSERFDRREVINVIMNVVVRLGMWMNLIIVD